MRPLAGVVTDREGQTLLIELESGLTVKVAQQHGLRIGSKCWVTYDFTRRKVGSVLPDIPDAAVVEDTTENVEPEGEHGVNGDIYQLPAFCGSGALRPCSDLWEFWDSGSGALLTDLCGE